MEMLSRFVHEDRVFVFGKPKRRWHFVALRDFARMVVAGYRRPEAVNKSFYVHGPEALTVREALEAYCRALHPEIQTLRGTPYWMLRLIARLRGDARMRAGIKMVSYLERVGERGDASEANAILGAARLTLDEWLRTQRGGARMAA